MMLDFFSRRASNMTKGERLLKKLMVLIGAAFFLSLPAAGTAEDFTTITGEQYMDVTIVRVEPDGITHKHDTVNDM